MNAIIKFMVNPITLWMYRQSKNTLLEWGNRRKHLTLGYMVSVTDCKFGLYNRIFDNALVIGTELGDFSYIGRNCVVSRANIGKFCSIGPNCSIGPGRHPSNTFVSTHPVFYSTQKQSTITFSDRDYFDELLNVSIGNDVWIGANAIICDGVSIGDGAIVAAGAVVTEDIPPYAIVGGVSAKHLKYRFNENEIKLLLEVKWWDRDINWLRDNFRKFHNIDHFLNQINMKGH